MRTEGLMEVCTPGKRSLSAIIRRDRVRLTFGRRFKVQIGTVVHGIRP
jgi:hypothetical protein